jgi:hypothetical protein
VALQELQNSHYVMILSNLIPLLEPEFKFDKGEEKVVKGKRCECVQVKRTGRPTVKMYFDAKFDHLVSAEIDGESLNLSKGTDVTYYFSDFRKSDDVQHWRKQEQWRNGKPYESLTIAEIRFLDKADDNLFTTPGLEDQFKSLAESYDLVEKRKVVQLALSILPPSKESEFNRLVDGMSAKNADARNKAKLGVLAYADLWEKNQVEKFDSKHVPSLMVLLKRSDEKRLQAWSVEALTLLGREAKDAVPELVKIARNSQDPDVLKGTLGVLRTTQDKSKETLEVYETHLDHSNRDVREGAALAILAVNPDRLPIDRVIELLGRPELPVQAAARKSFEQRSSALTGKDLPALRRCLKNSEPRVQLAALEAFGSIKDGAKEATADLLPLVAANDKAVSAQAINTLDKLGKLPEAIRVSTEPAALLPMFGFIQVKKIKAPEVLAVCEKHLEHADAKVNQAATMLLLETDPDRLSLDRLVELAGNSDDKLAAAGKILMAKRLKSAKAQDLPALRKGLKNPDREVRIVFLGAIASLKADGAAAAPDLAEMLPGAEKELAVPIMMALASMGKAGAKAAPALEKLVEAADMDKEMALAATQTLCRIDPENRLLQTTGIPLLLADVAPDLKLMMKKMPPGKSAQRSAAALVDLGEPAVEPVLQRLLFQRQYKKVPQKEQWDALAYRYVGFELLKGMAKKAKDKGDKKLSAALKKREGGIRNLKDQEDDYTKLLSNSSAEVRQLNTEARNSAIQACEIIAALPKQ